MSNTTCTEHRGEWQRVPYQEHCRYCGTLLKRGTPMFVLALPMVKRRKVRCEACAGPAPLDLAPLPERPDFSQQVERIRQIAEQNKRAERREWTAYKDAD